MPELPEVEVLKLSLESVLMGQKIFNVVKRFHKLRLPLSNDFESIKNSKILSLYRRAKYLVIELDNHKSLIVHLGMSGRFTIRPNSYNFQKHDHVIFYLESGEILVFNDQRRFGMIYLLPSQSIQNDFFTNIGPEPLSDEFNAKYLALKIKNCKSPIKNLLMDNKIIVGVGNIYASESLFLARINPKTSGNSLSIVQITSLTDAIKKVLQQAIFAGGTSLKDFVNGDNKPGYFKQQLLVYGRHNQKCSHCDELIVKIKQSGRASFYCHNCQQ